MFASGEVSGGVWLSDPLPYNPHCGHASRLSNYTLVQGQLAGLAPANLCEAEVALKVDQLGEGLNQPLN